MKRCSLCKFEKPLDEFHNNRSAPDGKHAYCKLCRSAYRKEVGEHSSERAKEYARNYYEEHSEERKQYRRERYLNTKDIEREQMKQWRLRNPDRARALNQAKKDRVRSVTANGVFISPERILIRDNEACYLCDEKVHEFHLDHIIPISRGGINSESNLAITHSSCNLRKRDKLPFELDSDTEQRIVYKWNELNTKWPHSLTMIIGPMFASKTSKLTELLFTISALGFRTVAFKPAIDDRYSNDEIISHDKCLSIPALNFDSVKELKEKSLGFEVIGIDEAQFLDEDYREAIAHLISLDKIIIMSGLNRTFRGEPFGDIPYYLAISDFVHLKHAVCVQCGEEATMTQRLINGKPAPFDTPTIQIGGYDTYEARCRSCWQEG